MTDHFSWMDEPCTCGTPSLESCPYCDGADKLKRHVEALDSELVQQVLLGVGTLRIAQVDMHWDMQQPYGELYIDAEGEPHFICHTTGDDFAQTKAALIKFIGLLQSQLDREDECPLKPPSPG